MDNEGFIKNNKYIKDVTDLTDNFLVIKNGINKTTVILVSLKFLLFLLL